MTPPQEPQAQVVMIDQTRIYDVLLEVRDQGKTTDAKVDGLGAKVDALVEDKKDHEMRIRALEQQKVVSPWQLWTALSGGAALLGIVVGIFKALGGL